MTYKYSIYPLVGGIFLNLEFRQDVIPTLVYYKQIGGHTKQYHTSLYKIYSLQSNGTGIGFDDYRIGTYDKEFKLLVKRFGQFNNTNNIYKFIPNK